MQHPSSGGGYSLSQTARLSQTQRLGLDPRQIPYQKYLKMSAMDLNQAVSDMLNGENINPALERISPKGLSSKAVEEKRWGLKESTYHSSEESSNKYQQFLESAAVSKSTLKEHLLLQLHIQPLEPYIMEAGELIIGNLDDRGFFQKRSDGSTITPQDVLRSSKARLSDEELKSLLYLMAQFDPVGTCVADERESILVQAKIKGNEPSFFYQIMEQDSQTLKNSSLEEVARKVGATQADVEAIKSYLKDFNPNPGSDFASEVEYLVPDMEIYFETNGYGEFFPVIKVENGFCDGLGISKEYRDLLDADEGDSSQIQEFVKEQVDQAKLFLDMLEFRQNSLKLIGKNIAESQIEFFLKGHKFLKAIKQKEFANKLNIEESRFSRLISGKTVKTKWGLFPLKYFFSSGGVASPYHNNEFISPYAVKAHIKEIIALEGSKKSVSDLKISQRLKERQINISRRTVSKYRNNLDVTSSM